MARIVLTKGAALPVYEVERVAPATLSCDDYTFRAIEGLGDFVGGAIANDQRVWLNGLGKLAGNLFALAVCRSLEGPNRAPCYC